MEPLLIFAGIFGLIFIALPIIMVGPNTLIVRIPAYLIAVASILVIIAGVGVV